MHMSCVFFLMIRRPTRSTRTDTLFPYTTLFRSSGRPSAAMVLDHLAHSLNDRDDPTLLYSPYLDFVARRTEGLLAGRPPRAYFIGGGAFTLPRAWAARLDRKSTRLNSRH